MKKNRGMEAKLQTSYILALWIDAWSDSCCKHKGKRIGGLQRHTNVHNCFHILHDFMVPTHCCVTFLTHYLLMPCPGYGKLLCTVIPCLYDIFKLSLGFCYYFILSTQMAAALCSSVIFLWPFYLLVHTKDDLKTR
jgi:hypothetical protein